MNKIRLKQRKLFKLLKGLVVTVAALLFVFIGVQPYVAEFNPTLAITVRYVLELLVVVILIVLFWYYSRYGKADSFLTEIEDEINDYGYYLTSRPEKDSESYINSMVDNLKQCR